MNTPYSAKCSRSYIFTDWSLKHFFTKINFVDQRFLMAAPIFCYISKSIIFTVREESTKTMHLENLALYICVFEQWLLTVLLY